MQLADDLAQVRSVEIWKCAQVRNAALQPVTSQPQPLTSQLGSLTTPQPPASDFETRLMQLENDLVQVRNAALQPVTSQPLTSQSQPLTSQLGSLTTPQPLPSQPLTSQLGSL